MADRVLPTGVAVPCFETRDPVSAEPRPRSPGLGCVGRWVRYGSHRPRRTRPLLPPRRRERSVDWNADDLPLGRRLAVLVFNRSPTCSTDIRPKSSCRCNEYGRCDFSDRWPATRSAGGVSGGDDAHRTVFRVRMRRPGTTHALLFRCIPAGPTRDRQTRRYGREPRRLRSGGTPSGRRNRRVSRYRRCRNGSRSPRRRPHDAAARLLARPARFAERPARGTRG